MGGGSKWGFQNFSSNGEQIYYTGINQDGENIRYSGGSQTSMMMNSQLGCASCHGDGGRGGIHAMHMDTMNAPDIRYEALLAENGEQNEGDPDNHNDDHAKSHAQYDLETFRKAVGFGTHPNGESLSQEMPRWKMSDQDIVDLFDFIKQLQ